MATKQGNTRKPTARFKVGDHVVVDCTTAKFEGAITSRSWLDPDTAENPLTAGWAYAVSNNPMSDGELWLERTISKRDDNSKIHIFPTKHPHEVSGQAEDPGQKKAATNSGLTRTQKVWLAKQYRITYRSIIQGLLSSGRFTKPDEVVAIAHQFTVASLKQFQKAEVNRPGFRGGQLV